MELSSRVRWWFQDLETDAGLGLCGGDTYGRCALPASSDTGDAGPEAEGL